MSYQANHSGGLDFIEFVKEHKCCVLGCKALNVDADHLKTIGMGRDRKKPELIEHYSCIPLCRKHHTERHQIGNRKFEEKYDTNLWYENRTLLVKWIIREFITHEFY